MLQLILLTATRLREASQMIVAELNEDGTEWTIPAARHKSKRDFLCPLSQAAQKLLAKAALGTRKRWVFTTNGTSAISGFSKWKSDFDKEVLALLRQTNPNAESPKLSIGLGADQATVVYDHGLSSVSSRGRRRDDESEIAYAYGDGYSEFPRWTLVSKEDALAAAREFFQTGRRPTNLAGSTTHSSRAGRGATEAPRAGVQQQGPESGSFPSTSGSPLGPRYQQD